MTVRTGRPLDFRLRVRGWLRVGTPLHVGGIALDPAEALPMTVDGLGRAYVPGTGLAGAFRAWMRGTDSRPEALGDLWGFVPRDGAHTRDRTDPRAGGWASRIVVRDAIIATTMATDADGLPTHAIDPATLPTRHGVGIDRITGAAAPEFLYARTVVPPASYLRLELDIESTEQDRDRDRARLGTLLAALSGGQIRLGAATRRGLGVVSLMPSPLSIHEHRLTDPDGLLAFLRDEPVSCTVAELEGADADLPERPELLTVRVDWRPAAPVMVRASGQGVFIDTLPLTTRLNGQDSLALTLTGGSIKGTLRSHAEFIERTVRGEDAPGHRTGNGSARDHSTDFRDQLDQLPAVKALFGAARTTPTDTRTGVAQGEPGSMAANGFLWGAGALTAEECISRTDIPASLWNTLTLGSVDAENGTDDLNSTMGTDGDQSTDGTDHADRAADVRDTVTKPRAKDAAKVRPSRLPETVRDRLAERGMDQADHVAIDRWTGGAADGRLYSVLEPHAVEWEPIRLSIDLTRLGTYRDTALALLLLVLRDLKHGRIPLGGMVTRGFGDVHVDEVTLTGGDWPEGTGLRDALATPGLQEAWRTYLEKTI
jgi:CRISPR/Cas system CSM-associated protein Csm3 (group 7 of RAMP superfamily)